MAEKNDGGAAFPSLERVEKYDDDNGRYVEHFAPVGGMSLRDYFAAKSMAATIGKRRLVDTDGKDGGELIDHDALQRVFEKIAASSYAMADAMLDEREK